MKFTTLDSFFVQLSAVMLPLFASPSTSTRELHDNAWLVWQMLWLFRESHASSPELENALQRALAHPSPHPAAPFDLRIAWMQDVGLPRNADEAHNPTDQVNAPLRLHKILANGHPNITDPRSQLKSFLQSYAGLPESAWNRIEGWLTAHEQTAAAATPSPQNALRSLRTHRWLAAQELKNVVMDTSQGQTLERSGLLHILSLPESFPRPASFMLADGTLWLAWPHSGNTTLHPIVQASLICHELAHLQRNHMLRSNPNSESSDSVWSSERDAMACEWDALMRYCQHQPEKLREQFVRNWYLENLSLQKQFFLNDWTHFTRAEHTPPTADDAAGTPISLPFLSAVYACLAEERWEANLSPA